QKIKVAYPHVIHGFTPNGMPVVYESPGQMNLKQLFRSELHSELSDECGDEWQEQLAAYAHAKQTRLQNDAVPFGFCVVMDVSGASPTSLSGDVMTYLSRAGEINSLHYPGSMRRATAVQAPFWLGAAWGAIKNVMPASVTVDLLSASQTMKGGLNKYIDEDQIPAEYGGKS
ncbi:sec14-like cytosolic factor, partial [Thalassiosira pseudonana CCMP1335]